jgi:hypothetical protein
MGSIGEGKTVAAFTRHLQVQARHWFGVLGEGVVGVTLSSQRQRTNSAVYRFQITGSAARHVVFVKLPGLRGGDHRDERPYFIPETDPLIKFRVQHAAMVALYGRFGNHTDPRFGAIRPLDILPDHAAFVMEGVVGDTIRQLLPKSSRLRSPFGVGGNRDVFEKTGAWLRAFHEMPMDTKLAVIHPGCTEFVDLMGELTDFLGQALKDERFFRSIAERAEVAALDTLQGSLPLGTRFGDFGLTNVLVSPGDGRITGFDTLAIWSAPIYEDIGYFLTGLKTYRAQVLSLGLGFGANRIAALESAFLKGYFHADPVPLREIRLYEVLRLLERWSAKLVRNRRQEGAGATLGAALLNHFMRKTVSSLLEDACKL